MSTLDSLQNTVSNPLAEFIVFDQTQNKLFFTHALALLESGYSIGCVSTSIKKALNLPLLPTAIGGIFRFAHDVDSPSILCFSSGTKNNQKGIIRTLASWKESFSLVSRYLNDQSDLRSIIIGSLPYSLSLFGVTESLFREKEPLLIPTEDLRWFHSINQKEEYILWITPLHAAFLIKAHGQRQFSPTHNIRFIFVGGAHFSTKQRSMLQHVFPNALIYSFYGTSETSFISVKDPKNTTESVGRICENVSTLVLDENKQPVAHYTTGNLWIKSNQIFSNYIDKSLKIYQLNGYIFTHDRGFVSDDNQLYFVGRNGRQISISGHNIDLDSLEQWYKDTLSVETLALIPISSHSKEHHLVLMTTQQINDMTWKLLKRKALQTLGTQGVAKKRVLCNTWPTLQSGKVDVKALENLL